MQKLDTNALDLHCYETFADFDEHTVENVQLRDTMSKERGLSSLSSSASSKLDNHGTNLEHFQIVNSVDLHKGYSECHENNDNENFGNYISVLDDNDYVQLLKSSRIIEDDKPCKKEITQINREDDFTRSLLKEFDKPSHYRKDQGVELASSLVSPIKKGNSIPCVWSQTYGRYDRQEQLVPEMTSSADDMDDSILEPELLVIRDEAMLESDSGSELDWNSLTPPAPASPSDQRVPESDSELFEGRLKYDHYISHSSPEFFSSFSPPDRFENSWRFTEESVQNVHFSHSDNDQVVPSCY